MSERVLVIATSIWKMKRYIQLLLLLLHFLLYLNSPFLIGIIIIGISVAFSKLYLNQSFILLIAARVLFIFSSAHTINFNNTDANDLYAAAAAAACDL